MRNIYLHLGLHKTATSSFQSTCFLNRDELERQGYFYPVFTCPQASRTGINNHSIPIYTLFSKSSGAYHINLKWGIHDLDEAKRCYQETLDLAMQKEIDVILSGEDISRLSKMELREFASYLSAFNRKIIAIASIRSPYLFHCSALQQIVRAGQHVNYTEYISQRATIEVILSVFNHQIKLLPFLSICSHSSGPVGALLETIGVDFSSINFSERNSGNSNAVVRAQNQINRRNPFIVNGRLNSNHRNLPEIEGEKFLLTQDELNLITHQLDEDNSYFSKNLAPEFCDESFPVSSDLSIDNLVDLIYECLPEVISPFTVDWLRNQAIKSEKSGNIAQAKDLMSLACLLRPGGEFIKQKLVEYRKRLQGRQG